MSSHPPWIQQHSDDDGATVYRLFIAHGNGQPFPNHRMEYKIHATFDNPGDCVRALVETGNRRRKIKLGDSYYNRQGKPI
tara:strand:- start:173 stop:412 length:240 start_codon:yes stop_codon:yes gene_type:complete